MTVESDYDQTRPDQPDRQIDMNVHILSIYIYIYIVGYTNIFRYIMFIRMSDHDDDTTTRLLVTKETL